MKRALISGICGQDGSYLAELLLDKSYEVHGVVRRISQPNFSNIAGIIDRLHLHTADMQDGGSLLRAIQQSQPDEIYNLAAMSQVRDSYDHPEVTQDINAGGLLRIFEAVRLLGIDCKVYQACHDAETMAVTPDGFKTHEKLSVGDLVYTFNEQTKAFELKPIEEVISYEYSGPMVNIDGRRVSQRLTPQHRVIVETDDGQVESIQAGCLSDHLLAGRPISYARTSRHSVPFLTSNAGSNLDEIVFSDFVEVEDRGNCFRNFIDRMGASDFCYLLGLYIGDGYTQRERTAKVKYATQSAAPKSATTGRFIGSDSAATIDRHYRSNYIFFAVPEMDKARNRLIQTLQRNGLTFNEHRSTVELASLPLARMFKLSGERARTKQIPDFVFGLSVRLQQQVLEGMIDSDGHWRGERAAYSTISEKLVSGLIRLCSNVGRYCSVTHNPGRAPIIKGTRVINSGPSYCVNIADKRTNKIYRHNISESNYSGTVWCLSVKDNHNFMVCRNGKLAFSGNCSSEMFGKVQEVPQTETTKFYPRSPYGSSKVTAYNHARIWREAYGMKVYCGILFNHESPRRGEAFVSRKICKAVAEIAAGTRKGFTLGNLDAKRDFGYAKEYVEWIWRIVQHPVPDDFVIATGETHSIREWVALAFGYIGIEDWESYVDYDKSLTRPAEVDMLLGDPTKSRLILGFEPKVKFHQLVEIMMRAELEKLGVVEALRVCA